MDSDNIIDPELFTGPKLKLAGQLRQLSWREKKTYEYNDMAIDLRLLDPCGTLELNKERNKRQNTIEPQVAIVDGYLLINFKREMI
jgi:hypothetical protein